MTTFRIDPEAVKFTELYTYARMKFLTDVKKGGRRMVISNGTARMYGPSGSFAYTVTPGEFLGTPDDYQFRAGVIPPAEIHETWTERLLDQAELHMRNTGYTVFRIQHYSRPDYIARLEMKPDGNDRIFLRIYRDDNLSVPIAIREIQNVTKHQYRNAKFNTFGVW